MKRTLFFLSVVMMFCSGGSNRLNAQLSWESVNGPFGGSIRDMAAAPSGTLYVIAILNIPVYPFTTEIHRRRKFVERG